MKLFIEEEFSGTTSLGAMNLIQNAKLLISKTKPSSECHRAVKALFVQFISKNNAHLNDLGSKRSITRARQDFRILVSHGYLDNRKKKHITIEVIVTLCSTVAGSIQCLCIRLNKIYSTKVGD